MTSTVTLAGKPFEVRGSFPQEGQVAPAFTLVGKDLADVPLGSFTGQRKVLNIFPSIDTPTCAASVRKFNEKASGLANVVVPCISAGPESGRNLRSSSARTTATGNVRPRQH